MNESRMKKKNVRFIYVLNIIFVNILFTFLHQSMSRRCVTQYIFSKKNDNRSTLCTPIQHGML